MIEKDVMPGLEFLRLYNCKELRGFLSHGLNHLNHLKQVFLYDVSEELLEQVCRETNIVSRSPTRGMILDRADDDDAEHEWILNTAEAIHGKRISSTGNDSMISMVVQNQCSVEVMQQNLSILESTNNSNSSFAVLISSMALSMVDGLKDCIQS
ncbi:hypothetical protein DITRI_Ditri05aG0064400 [Diplodiscus trichospermus]